MVNTGFSIQNISWMVENRWDDEEDTDMKRRKEAELLVKNDLPLQYIRGYVVYNLEAKQSLIFMGVEENMVVVRPNYYF